MWPVLEAWQKRVYQEGSFQAEARLLGKAQTTKVSLNIRASDGFAISALRWQRRLGPSPDGDHV